jgi:hypothetical protein
VGAVRRGVCVHGVVAGLCAASITGLREASKWEQSGVVCAWMVLSLGCVKRRSGSSVTMRVKCYDLSARRRLSHSDRDWRIIMTCE